MLDSQSPQLVTAAELKSILKCSLAWVRKATQQGRLPFVRCGRAVRYETEQVLTVLRAQQQSK